MQRMLKYYLIPYLLFDIGVNLLFQAPIRLFEKFAIAVEIIGF
jgi:hypothetical protein